MSESVSEEISFHSGDEECAATLYQPSQRPRGSRLPCVVMCNGYSLTRRDGLPLFAERCAASGLAALAFDFRHLGDSGGEPRQLMDYERQRADLAAAVSFVRTIDGIDPERVAAWGYSVGGGLVLQVAAADSRIAAAVASFPMVDGLAFAMAGNPLLNLRLLAAAVRDSVGRATVRVPVVGPPGSVAVFDKPEAVSGIARAVSEDSLWRNEVCARTFLRAGLFRPVKDASKVRCPLLVCLAENDTLVPLRPIVRVAERASDATLRRYPGDHFDAQIGGELFERVVADQVEFLTAHLRSGGP